MVSRKTALCPRCPQWSKTQATNRGPRM
ncbi:MAG: hypothetical protein ACRD3W_13040 [Terriglobales bacterium]